MAVGTFSGFGASLKRVRRSLSFRKQRAQVYQPTIGEDLQIVEQDHLVKTHPANNHNRRTLMLKKENDSWGFTIQSYGIHHKTSNELEDVTYVDYVEIGGPACVAGMRKGDIILSINGTSVDDKSHQVLVNLIRACGDTMRMVVLFEDCSRKVEMNLRYIKLKKLLAAKEFELNSIDEKISRLQNGEHPHIPRSLSVAGSSHWDGHWSLSPGDSAPIDTFSSLPRKRSSLAKNMDTSTLPKRSGSRCRITDFVQSDTPANISHACSQDNIQAMQDPGTFTKEQVLKETETTSSSSCSQDNASTVTDLVTNNKVLKETETISSSSDIQSDTCAIKDFDTVCMSCSQNQFNSLPLPKHKKRPTNLPLIPQTGSLNRPKHKLKQNSCLEDPNVDNVVMETRHEPTTNDNLTPEGEGPGTKPGFVKQVLSRSISRSKSFRASFRHSMSPANGESYHESANYVVTEENHRVDTDPDLLHLKQGDLDLYKPVVEIPCSHSTSLVRSLSSPAVRNFKAMFDIKRKQVEKSHNQSDNEPSPTAPDEYVNEVPVLKRSQSDSSASMNQNTNKPQYDCDQRNTAKNSELVQNMCKNNKSHSTKSCDSEMDTVTNNRTCVVTHCAPPTFCSDTNCNTLCFKQSVLSESKQTSHDSNGNPTPQSQTVILRQKDNRLYSNSTQKSRSSDCIPSVKSTGNDIRSRPWSTGSDITMRSQTSVSSTDSYSSSSSGRSSGSFEYYTDPFTPSPEESTNQSLPFPQRLSETPIVSSLRKVSRRMLTYSRHKDMLKQEVRLVNINEEDEVTKL